MSQQPLSHTETLTECLANIPNARPICGILNRHLPASGRSLGRLEFLLKPTDIENPGLLPQGRRLPVGLPRPHPGPRVHPADRPRALLRRLHDQLEVQRLPGNPGPHLRPSLRAGLPAQPRRGRDPGQGQEGAGRDLPPQARRRRLQGRRRHQGQHAQGAGEERQAHRLHRRRPRLAHRGARSRRAGLRDRDLRPGSQARRLHPHPDPALPPARVGDRRGSGLHHRHRQHRVPPQEDRTR